MFDNALTATLVPSGNTYSDKNTLGILQFKLTLVDRLASGNSHFVPYLGMGVGILYVRWEQEQFPEPGIPRTWLKGTANPFDVHFLTGFDVPIYHELSLNGEIEYSYEPADWKIQNVDTGVVTKFQNLNLGGIALRLGLAYNF